MIQYTACLRDRKELGWSRKMLIVFLGHSESDESSPTCPNRKPRLMLKLAIISAYTWSQISFFMNNVKKEN
jgi:hypothetical protein